jgi:hypothetical protein
MSRTKLALFFFGLVLAFAVRDFYVINRRTLINRSLACLIEADLQEGKKPYADLPAGYFFASETSADGLLVSYTFSYKETLFFNPGWSSSFSGLCYLG